MPKTSANPFSRAVSIYEDFVRILTIAQDTLALLSEMPSAGAEQPFSFPELHGIRMLPVKGFERHLVFYRPIKEGIELIRLYHSARDPNRIDLNEEAA